MRIIKEEPSSKKNIEIMNMEKEIKLEELIGYENN